MSLLADAGEVAHRLSETEVLAFVFLVLGAIVTTLMTGPLFDRFSPHETTPKAVAAQ